MLSEMELTSEDKLLLACAKINLRQSEIQYIESLLPQITDWNYALKIFVERGAAPLMYKLIPNLSNHSIIPEYVILQLKKVYYLTLSRNLVLYDHFYNIVKAFYVNGIEVIPLKGIYLAEKLYKDIALRQLTDIDLLVKPEDGLLSLSLLKEMGYVSPYEGVTNEFIDFKSQRIHYPPMVKNGVSVEIHTRLHRISEKYDVNPDECWQNSIKTSINNIEFSTLELNDLLIYLCVHLDRHFRVGKMQFTCYYDILNLLDVNTDSFDWYTFINRCVFFKSEQVVLKYIVLIHIYFAPIIPKSIFQKYKIYLSSEEEERFIAYLHGFTFVNVVKSTVTDHLESLRKINTFSDYKKYIFNLLFPSKSFMIEKYKIKNTNLILFYYPYRYYIGFKGMTEFILFKFRK